MMSLTESFNPSKYTPGNKNEQNEREKLQWRQLALSSQVVRQSIGRRKSVNHSSAHRTLTNILSSISSVLRKHISKLYTTS